MYAKTFNAEIQSDWWMQLCIICAVSKIDTVLQFTQLWNFNETGKLIEKFI